MSTISGSDATRVGPVRKVAGGPRGVPILGCLPDIRRDRLGFLVRVSQAYPEVAHYRIANLSIYQLTQPAGIEHVLQTNHHNYVKGPIFDDLRGVLGNGLFLSEGDFWLRQRRLMQPTFHRQRIAGFVELMVGETEAMLAGWQGTAAEGRPVDVAAAMTGLTMVIVSRALFGTRVAGDTRAISHAVTTVLADFIFRFDRPLYPPVIVPTPHNRQVLAGLRTLDETVYRIIGERRRQGEAAPQGDFLAMLMDARDEETGEGMSDRQLRDEALTFFLAGHETAANALAWTFFLLSTHPEAARRLQAELAEAQAVLATVAQRYRLDLLPGQRVEPEPQVTLRPRGGLPMLLKAR